MSTRTRRTLVGLVAIVIAGLATTFLSATPSQAEQKKLKLSTSASGPWLDNLNQGLFDGDVIAPGLVTETFWVKNNSSQPARVSLYGEVTGGDSPFKDLLEISSNLGGTQAVFTPVKGKDNRCKNYVTGPSVQPGAVQQVDVVLDFDNDSETTTHEAMNQSASMGFVVTLSQVGPKGKIDICGVQARSQPTTDVCSDTNTAVVTALGSSNVPTTCPVVAGVEAFSDGQGAGSANRPGALGSTGASRNLNTLLPLAVGLLLAGAALLGIRRRVEPDRAGRP